MIYIFAARQAHRRREIDDVGLIRSELNLADNLTKLRGNDGLLQAMQSARIKHPIEDVVVRPDNLAV
jgi:hypothetical protein